VAWVPGTGGGAPLAVTLSADGTSARAFEAPTGLAQWEAELPACGSGGGPVAVAEGPPGLVPGGRSLVVGACGRLHALEADTGRVVATVGLGPGAGVVGAAAHGGRVVASVVYPSAGGGGRVAVVGWSGAEGAAAEQAPGAVEVRWSVPRSAVAAGGAFVSLADGGATVVHQPWGAPAAALPLSAVGVRGPARGLSAVSGALVAVAHDAGATLVRVRGAGGAPPLEAEHAVAGGAYAEADGAAVFAASVRGGEAAVERLEVGRDGGVAGAEPWAAAPAGALAVRGDLSAAGAADGLRRVRAAASLPAPGGGAVLLVSADEHLTAVGRSGAALWERGEWRALLSARAPPVFSELPPPGSAPGPAAGPPAGAPASLLGAWAELQVLGFQALFRAPDPAARRRAEALRGALATSHLPASDRNGHRMAVAVASEAGVVAALHNGDGRVLWAYRAGEGCAPVALRHHPAADAGRFFGGGGPGPGPAPVVTAAFACAGGAPAPEQRSVHVALDGFSGAVLAEAALPGRRIVKAVPVPGTGGELVVSSDAAGRLGAAAFPAGAREALLEAAAAAGLFAWVAQEGSAVLSGYRVGPGEGASLALHPAWSVATPGPIEAVAARDPSEPVPSRTRRTLRGAVGFKYLNPNTLLVVSRVAAGDGGDGGGGGGGGGGDGAAAGGLEARVVDTVTGRSLASQYSPGAAGPVRAVFGEHWGVYSYWSVPNARPELVSVELADGAAPAVGFWDAVAGTLADPAPQSSFDAGKVLVASQTYFAPGPVAALGLTRTRHGIAAKGVVLCLDSGAVLLADQRLLDPRLPRLDPSAMARHEYDERARELKASGVPLGHLGLSERMAQRLSHRHAVAGARGAVSAAMVVESTSGVLVFGSDLFYTRAFPSKHFDALADDFNFLAVTASLAGMVAVLLYLRGAARRNQLRHKWAD